MSSTSGHQDAADHREPTEPATTTRTTHPVPHATTRVAMAFPFSSIKISGDAVACRDLALLVEELCDALAHEVTPDDLRELGSRARELAASLAD